MEKVVKATLRYLFQNYLKGPTVSYTINVVTDLYPFEAIAVSDYLVEKNWIRERWIDTNNLVSCRITVAGIEEVNPLFIDTKLRQLVGGLAGAGGSKNLMEIFQHRIEEYSIALDIVYQLEKLGMIVMLHQDGNIFVELTDFGWKHFEKKGKSLFTLMAVA